MASTTTLLCFLAFLCFVTKGISTQCSLTTLKIEQALDNGQFKVNLTNTCDCTVYQVKFLCPNFFPRANINPSGILKIDRDHCLVNNGLPIYAGKSFSFTYLSPHVNFALSDYLQACS